MRLKELRNEKDWLQNEVVKKLNELGGSVSQQQYSLWETNGSAPQEKNIKLLMKVFDCSRENLFENDKEDLYSSLQNYAYEYGVKCGKHGLTYQQFTADAKKSGLMNIANKDFNHIYDKFVEFVLNVSGVLGISVPLEIANITNKTEIQIFFIGMYNGVISTKE